MIKWYLIILVFIISNDIYCQENNLLLIREWDSLSHETKYGYINKKGEIVIQPTYDYADDFIEGLAVVRLEYDPYGSTYGIIDTSGKIVFQISEGHPDFNYSEGLLKVEFLGENKRVIYYDRTGKIVIDKNIFFGYEFSGGLASVSFSRNGKIGFINKFGKLVIDTIYSRMGRFVNGLIYNEKDNESGLLDTSGNFTKLKCLYDDKLNLPESFINPKKFSNTGDFHYGLMPVLKGLMNGYINTNGEYAIRPIFYEANNFSDGLAAVRYNGKYGYIDTLGNFIIEPKFKYAESFSEGLAFVNTGDFQFSGPHTNAVINKNGEVVINVDSVLGVQYHFENGEKWITLNMFYGASKFKNGIAKFYEGFHFSGRIRYIDINGKLIW